ncbi:putative Lipoprotein [Cyanobium sp. NIES-981]|nr:putative Lipoprotein [Cyanobium sp. NIES-981]
MRVWLLCSAVAALASAGVVKAWRGDGALTLPIGPVPVDRYFALAERDGLPGAHDLRLQLDPQPGTQEVVAAYLREEHWLVPISTADALTICSLQARRCPTLILVLSESAGADQLMARPWIHSVQDLRGKRVAVGRSAVGRDLLMGALEREGIDPAQVRLVTMPMAAMPASLRRGEVDAAVLAPPYSNAVQRLGLARSLEDSRSSPGEVLKVLAVDPARLQQARPQLVRLLRVWQAAHAAAAAEPRQARTWMGKAIGLNATGFQRAEAGLLYHPLVQQPPMLKPEGLLAWNLQLVASRYHSRGWVEEGVPRPAVDASLVQEALQTPGAQPSLTSSAAPK